MTLQEILQQPNIDDVIKALSTSYSGIKTTYETCEKQYDYTKHDIFDETIRPKKEVKKPTGQKVNGKDQYETSFIDVARVAVPFQKLLVNRVASFLLNDGIDIQSDAENDREQFFVELLEKIWADNKLDYQTKKIARILMSECEVAEIWYFVEQANFWQKLFAKLGLTKIQLQAKIRILANSYGDTLYPHFNEFNDMDAFSRQYTITIDQKQVTKFETYTVDKIYHYTKEETGWVADEGYPKANLIKKIPVIYYAQANPEWHEVQKLIDRFETLLSNFADSNDYFGSPMIKIKGTVTGFATKGEQGKIIELQGEGASADYLTWEQAPESIKIELETLQNLIFSMTQVPDISFSQMSKLGNMSGVSRRLMFIDMHLKCFNKIEVFGEMMQRRLNLLKAIIGNVVAVKYSDEAENVELWPEFNPYLPSADEELITSLVTATGGKPIMSQRTAVKMNPYVEDPDAEIDIIAKEKLEENAEPMI